MGPTPVWSGDRAAYTPQPYIKLRFVCSYDWMSRIIRSGEMGYDWSHVECATPWGTLLGAHADGGIQDRPFDYDTTYYKQRFVIIPCSVEQANKFHAFLKSMVGKPYDFVGIGMMAEGVATATEPHADSPDGLVCSALIMAGIEDAGDLWGKSPATARMTTPRDLMQMCAATKSVMGTDTLRVPPPPVGNAVQSPLKKFTHPAGGTVVFGRKAPIAQGLRLNLKNYLYKGIERPPAIIKFPKVAQPVLKNVYLNDELGDCVIAGMAHLLAIMFARAGLAVPTFTSQQIIELYHAIGGYVQGDPSTDQGCDEETALNYWVQNGIWWPAGRALNADTHKAYGWVAVDGTNPEEVRQALWLFENLFFGVDLPDAWVNSMPPTDGFRWAVNGKPNPKNGHCFVGISAQPGAIGIDTWGMEGWVTDDAVAYYTKKGSGGQLYAILSPDIINKAKGKAANGFDWSQLVADLESMKAA